MPGVPKPQGQLQKDSPRQGLSFVNWGQRLQTALPHDNDH